MRPFYVMQAHWTRHDMSLVRSRRTRCRSYQSFSRTFSNHARGNIMNAAHVYPCVELKIPLQASQKHGFQQRRKQEDTLGCYCPRRCQTRRWWSWQALVEQPLHPPEGCV